MDSFPDHLRWPKATAIKIYLTIQSQQTTMRDFTCSVSEFTSSVGSIHVNSPDSVNKFGEITSCSCDDMYQWNRTSSDPLWHVSNSWQQAEHVYSCEYTWKHILVERYQLWTSMTCTNWFRNGSLFAGMLCIKGGQFAQKKSKISKQINTNNNVLYVEYN